MKGLTLCARSTISSCTLLAVLFCAPGASAASLRVGVNSGWMMPFAQIDSGLPTNGIVVDLYRAVAADLGLRLQPLMLPRKRIEQLELDGKIDFSCYANRAWTLAPDEFVWSDPLFEITDVLVGHRDTPNPGNTKGVPSSAILSTVLGYVYPSLEDQFAAGRLRREDTQDQNKVLLKVSANRTAYGITNSQSLSWFRRSESAHALADWHVVIDRADFYCSVPKRGAIPAARIIGVLRSMKKDGRIERILRSYR